MMIMGATKQLATTIRILSNVLQFCDDFSEPRHFSSSRISESVCLSGRRFGQFQNGKNQKCEKYPSIHPKDILEVSQKKKLAHNTRDDDVNSTMRERVSHYTLIVLSTLLVTMSLSSTPLRALVVGGTSGIGHGIALALAKRGDIEVTIAGRSAERGASIVEQMNGVVSASSSSKLNHKFVAVDGFDLLSVKALATTQPAPDILVMTQGMATLQGYTPTIKDGIDQKLQLHYFSRFYLTSLLAPNMKPNARVLTVLSAGVHGKYQGYDKDFELKNNKSYSIKNAADAAGYYTDAGLEALSELNPDLVMAHAAPGMVNTNWGTEFPAVLRVMVVRPMMSLFGKNKEDLGETLVSSLMKLPKGYSLLDQKGAVIENGIKHTREERDVILEKTLAILPDL
jgi:NAD(P)-dependent dehydrogenase (short-subunit alcohol dehydrogenase family)